MKKNRGCHRNPGFILSTAYKKNGLLESAYKEVLRDYEKGQEGFILKRN
jgi:hypothetical protein